MKTEDVKQDHGCFALWRYLSIDASHTLLLIQRLLVWRLLVRLLLIWLLRLLVRLLLLRLLVWLLRLLLLVLRWFVWLLRLLLVWLLAWVLGRRSLRWRTLLTVARIRLLIHKKTPLFSGRMGGTVPVLPRHFRKLTVNMQSTTKSR